MAYFERTNIIDERSNVVNPASEESIILLRRIAKLLESTAATDPQQRQRITLDTITAGVALPTVTAVTTVATVSAVTAVTNIAGMLGWNQQSFADPARTAYNTGIRSQLTFA
jgi:hypothetical protein